MGNDVMTDELIMRVFCACAAYPEQPGSVVCWKCEQPLAEIDPDDLESALAQNLLLLCVRYRAALEKIANYPASVPYSEKWVHWATQAREALGQERTAA